MDNTDNEYDLLFQNYRDYLKFLNEKLDDLFENQKEYIFCKMGCAKCCKNAQFPFSLIEIQYALYGFSLLPDETKSIIEANLAKVLEQKKNFKGEKFLYTCPYLINDVCSIYEYRGVICRSFGLINKVPEGCNPQVPFCCFEGGNYSNVLDEKTGQLSSKKVKELGLKEEPVGFNVNYEYLTGDMFEEIFDFSFGEKKPMIEWLEN